MYYIGEVVNLEYGTKLVITDVDNKMPKYEPVLSTNSKITSRNDSA